LNFLFWVGAAIVFLAVWSLGVYFFWRIRGKGRLAASSRSVSPALRLADQWLLESQRRVEEFAQKSEEPLGRSQNELLELRLEAGRLPQGAKRLRMVRETLGRPMDPAPLKKTLLELTRLYLVESDFHVVSPSFLIWNTPLGQTPCLEVEEREGPRTETRMRTLLFEADKNLEAAGGTAVSGGFLYFANGVHYQECLGHPEWMEGLKARRWMAVDFKGLTALLLALRLARSTEKVLQVFQEGVQATQPLTGQSERMNQALSALGADSLQSQAVLEGNSPERLNP